MHSTNLLSLFAVKTQLRGFARWASIRGSMGCCRRKYCDSISRETRWAPRDIFSYFTLFSSLKTQHLFEKKLKKLVIFYFGREIIRHQCIYEVFLFTNSLLFYAKFIKFFFIPHQFHLSTLLQMSWDDSWEKERDDDDVVDIV